MNMTEVTARVAEITAIDQKTCHTVLDALDDVSGAVLKARMKGEQLNETAAVEEIAAATGVEAATCRTILAAFEQTFGEALADKFRFFRRK